MVRLSHFAGRVGDHNDRAMVGSRELTATLADRLGVAPTVIGVPAPALNTVWTEELEAARPALEAMGAHLNEVFRTGQFPVTAIGRCAVALATLPVVAAWRPDAVVVWFDAHADLNTPDTSTTGYLGGLALSGPLGLWDSGLGAGLSMGNAVLVGARDIDPPERQLIASGPMGLVPVGPAMVGELRRIVAGRPVYVHLDCDVLEAGLVPTDYLVPGGLTLADLTAAAEVLAESEVVGIEVGELECAAESANPRDNPRSNPPSNPRDNPPSYVTALVESLEPLLQR